MYKYLKLIIIFTVVVGWCFYWPMNLRAEFYKYVDKQGRIFYVDDLTKIPEEYRKQIEVYREKYDYLPEEERSRALEKERQRIEQHEQEQQLQTNAQLQEMQQAEEEERSRQAKEAKQKLMENMQTRVVVEGNRILVPVTLVNNGIEVAVQLLLDTGASHLVLHREVATQLNIIALRKGLAQVAGGQNIYIETGQISSFKVGPFEMQKADVLIINHEGEDVSYSGLLGMNFLRNVQYTIDYQNQVIRWQPPVVDSSAVEEAAAAVQPSADEEASDN
ncbi:MAG: clan AA aspartic protease [Desulfobacterales bacterium]|nr:MAG: clan AA aspartic protease [Desulfobacterales bacterium]